MTPLACRFQSLLCPLRNSLALELCDRSEDVEDQATGRGCRVDIFSEGPEARAARFNDFNNVEKVAQGPRQAIILGDNDDITITQLIKKAIELGAFAQRSTDFVGEDPQCPRPVQGVELGIKVLVVGRDAGISYDHA